MCQCSTYTRLHMRVALVEYDTVLIPDTGIAQQLSCTDWRKSLFCPQSFAVPLTFWFTASKIWAYQSLSFTTTSITAWPCIWNRRRYQPLIILQSEWIAIMMCTLWRLSWGQWTIMLLPCESCHENNETRWCLHRFIKRRWASTWSLLGTDLFWTSLSDSIQISKMLMETHALPYWGWRGAGPVWLVTPLVDDSKDWAPSRLMMYCILYTLRPFS